LCLHKSWDVQRQILRNANALTAVPRTDAVTKALLVSFPVLIGHVMGK